MPRSVSPRRPSARAAEARGARRDPRSGFTILEVMVVAALLSLAALITLPRIFPETARVQAAASEVQSGLQKAQRTAILNQHDVRVLFDEDAGQLTIHLDRDNDGAIGTGERIDVIQLPEGTGFGRGDVAALPWGESPVSFDDGVVVFHRDGSASREGGVYVSSIQQLRAGGRAGETRAIEVARATGAVRCRAPNGAEGWRGNCQ